MAWNVRYDMLTTPTSKDSKVTLIKNDTPFLRSHIKHTLGCVHVVENEYD
jgi:hypothetical protein